MRKNNPTFLFFLNRYKRYRSLHVRYASLHLLSVLLSRYVKPEQEDRIKDVLCLQNARKIYKRIINEKHLSASYRNRLIGSFRQIVQKAYTWGYITPKQQRDTEGILENLPDQQSRRKEREFYTKEQIELFLNNVEKEDRLMFRLFCYLGARISEFHGLTWDCVDVKNQRIEIKRQLVHQKSGTWVLTPILKTNESYRVCPIPKGLSDELVSYRDTVPHRPMDFVFSLHPNHHSPYGKTTFRRRMDAAIAKAGLPRITPHGFRHSKATLLMHACHNLEEGKAAAKFLGHSLTMFMETYGHATEETIMELLQRVDG